MFCICPWTPGPKSALPVAQPTAPTVRQRDVIGQPASTTGRRIAIDLILRVIAIAVVTLVILGILPAIAAAVA
jgi:hypothetical protein